MYDPKEKSATKFSRNHMLVTIFGALVLWLVFVVSTNDEFSCTAKKVRGTSASTTTNLYTINLVRIGQGRGKLEKAGAAKYTHSAMVEENTLLKDVFKMIQKDKTNTVFRFNDIVSKDIDRKELVPRFSIEGESKDDTLYATYDIGRHYVKDLVSSAGDDSTKSVTIELLLQEQEAGRNFEFF